MPQPLLFRDGRRLALTDAGRVFLGHAEQILATGREAELALSAGSPQHSTVVLGVFGSAAATIVPPAMRALAHGPVTVETREVGVDELGAAVATGTVDVGLGVGYPDAPEPPLRGVQTEVLSTEELLLAVPHRGPRAPSGRTNSTIPSGSPPMPTPPTGS